MNPKFKELAIKAGAYEDGNTVLTGPMDVAKFAELIVRECCELLKGSGDAWEKFSRNPPQGQAHNAGAALFAAYRLKEDAVDMLEEHFGVES